MDNDLYIILKKQLKDYADSILPEITAADNGETLVASNGEWVAGVGTVATISVSGTTLVIQGQGE